MPALYKGNIIVAPSPIHGLGVFADQDFNVNDIIEECPLILVPNTDTTLIDYTFLLKSHNADKFCGFILGYGSIYNHSETANATYFYDEENNLMRFVAKQPIETGSEICTSYGDYWFSIRGAEALKPSRLFRIRKHLRRLRPKLRIILLMIAMIEIYILSKA
jgi:hypothetical protein